MDIIVLFYSIVGKLCNEKLNYRYNIKYQENKKLTLLSIVKF